MALKMQSGKLAQPVTFKTYGKEQYRVWPAGHRVRYSRSPVWPGEFVIWADAGLKWFARCRAIDLPTNIKENSNGQ